MNTVVVLAAALPLALVAAGLRRVPAQNARPVRRLGRHLRILGPGWHWIVPLLERSGRDVDLIGHHLRVDAGPATRQAELYYQIVEPQKAGATLEAMDEFVADQARQALGADGQSSDQLKHEINRRVGRLGLRVIRCSMLLP
jgi:regulator of protease activity HflC (stomatin/prohibitin superfamily)